MHKSFSEHGGGMRYFSDRRFLRTCVFCIMYARTAYGLPPSVKLPVGDVDLLKGTIPKGLEDILDIKKGSPPPQWVAEAEQSHPRVSQACRVALAAIGTVMKMLQNEDPPASPKSKSKEAKKGKNGDTEMPKEELSEAQKDILTRAYTLVEECLQFESQIIEQRYETQLRPACNN